VIVVDSSFVLAYCNLRDVNHALAAKAFERLAAGQWGKGLILDWVFIEVVTVLKRKCGSLAAFEASSYLRHAHQLEFVQGSELFRSALSFFEADAHSPLGFVDHAVATVARQRCGGKVLTFDAAFRGLPGITVEPAG
jgi:predicted nucleic acid-binding protein